MAYLQLQPLNPHILTYGEVIRARGTIGDGVRRTACERSDSLSTKYGMEVFLKLEKQQRTGSFKERGALNALLRLPEEVKRNGVITASGGNFAMALAYHRGSIPVTVVLPITTPLIKRDHCREYGATVVIHGADLNESEEEAYRLKTLHPERELRYISGFDYPDAIAGYGTVGLEIMEQVEEVDAVIVSVGGAGLIAGISTAVKEHHPKTIKVIGVEPTRCASYSEALQHGSPHLVQPGSSLADGLVVPMVGANAFATASRLVDRTEQVEETFIAQAILHLAEKEKSIVEGAGAAGVAALIQGSLDDLKGKTVVIVICGGNIDMTTLGRSLERGLAADGRLFRVGVIVRDRPGGIAELTEIIKNRDINIRHCMTFEQAWLLEDVHSVRVNCVLETRNRQQAHELIEELRQHYDRVFWDANEPFNTPMPVVNGE